MLSSKKKAQSPLPLLTRVEEPALAKINLSLHVTGRRADGYHLLDSLVVFADCGERVRAEMHEGPADLRVTGPLAEGVPEDDTNLVLKAASLIKPLPRVSFHLHKTLPMEAGIGGGSSDAAAALRALTKLTGADLPPLAKISALGADIPVCLMSKPQRVRGAGEHLAAITTLPDFFLLLVNPGVALPTGKVFGSMSRRRNAPMEPVFPKWEGLSEFADWLRTQRNDMEDTACAIAPEIHQVLSAISAQPGCLMARMSGSGATCFGIFESRFPAEAGASALSQNPGWWVRAVPAAVT